MRKEEVRAALGVDVLRTDCGEPARPTDMIGHRLPWFIVQQDVLREIGKLAQWAVACQQCRTADGRKVLPHEQLAVKFRSDRRPITDRYIDFLAREVGEQDRYLQTHIDPGNPLAETAEARHEPARNEGRRGADRQCLGILAPLHIGGSVCELVE
jgi:hypothetical protein